MALALLWLTPVPGFAQGGADGRWFGGSDAYERCLGAIDEDALQAFDRALAWRDQGGGPPAVHCAAVALSALGQYGDAADRLDALAQDTNNGLDAPIRAQLLVQAANAWMLEGFPDQGVESLNAALSLNVNSDPLSAEIYFDRARARIMDGLWDEAIEDLTRTLRYAPGAKDARTLRATGYRLRENEGAAIADLARVLDDDPDYAPALLERGLVFLGQGNSEAARADWIRVLQLDVEEDLKAEARAYLHQLDFPDGL
jgi:tetratricopeptide (TPR) repeat protein